MTPFGPRANETHDLPKVTVTGFRNPFTVTSSVAEVKTALNYFGKMSAIKQSLETPTPDMLMQSWIEGIKNPTQEKSLSEQMAEAAGRGLSKDN